MKYAFLLLALCSPLLADRCPMPIFEANGSRCTIGSSQCPLTPEVAGRLAEMRMECEARFSPKHCPVHLLYHPESQQIEVRCRLPEGL